MAAGRAARPRDAPPHQPPAPPRVGPGATGSLTHSHILPLTLAVCADPATLNPQPSTLNPQPATLNPGPSTQAHRASSSLPEGGISSVGWISGGGARGGAEDRRVEQVKQKREEDMVTKRDLCMFT